ncbi:uncharacterized protein TNCT_372061 [Trichonephila clavata]|uniref:Uncharacterized protein n=1 Tax=Trichonephila clavata TaxID=2740835 RepID=A0A8X6KX85_TRICU|nr:uncharacterized protein TNCT_372061 [Trichonephila clavata]
MELKVASLLVTVAVVCLFFLYGEARVIKRRAEGRYCSGSTPCGWEIYQPATRTTDYFVKSPCECPGGTRCMRYSDDISIAAYVYKCRPGNEEGHVWNE